MRVPAPQKVNCRRREKSSRNVKHAESGKEPVSCVEHKQQRADNANPHVEKLAADEVDEQNSQRAEDCHEDVDNHHVLVCQPQERKDDELEKRGEDVSKRLAMQDVARVSDVVHLVLTRVSSDPHDSEQEGGDENYERNEIELYERGMKFSHIFHSYFPTNLFKFVAFNVFRFAINK